MNNVETLEQYRDATKWLCDNVEPVIQDQRLDFPETSFADMFYSFSIGFEVQDCDDGLQYKINDNIAIDLVDGAKANPDIFDLCCSICALNLRSNEHLPTALNNFAANVLTRNIERPKIQNRPRKKNFLEKSFLLNLAAHALVRFQLSKTRNDVSERYSLADAIAEALTVCGCKTTYSEIKNLLVHKSYAQLRKEYELCIEAYKFAANNILPNNALRPDWYAKSQAILDARPKHPSVIHK